MSPGAGNRLEDSTSSPLTRTRSPLIAGNTCDATKRQTPVDDDLPSNVSTEAQLATLPDFCLSGNKERPLRHVGENGDVYNYNLQPMFYSVIFILMVELLERFCFYGINYTQALFLTGAYDDEWNAGMTSISASSFVSISTAVAYSTPFVGAFLADAWLGDYWTILFGALIFYIPGLLLIMLSSVPYLLGDSFNKGALSIGLLLLWPMGTGIVKSIVNIFGARQFHPLLQSSLIESYYVKFYMCINIGALVGGVVVPVVGQYDITLAYSYPVGMLCIGVTLFALGSRRYVRHLPSGELFQSKSSSIGNVNTSVGLSDVFRIAALIIPFNIAYSQMATTFIVQGTVMQKAFGFIDAASMNNADALSVLLFGWLIGAYFYPALAKRGLRIPTTYKFAIGSGLGALAIGWAIFMEYKIHKTFRESGEKVNILWQAVAYILIGAGEIFAVSAAYEAAFIAAPPEKKALASAANLFCVGGIPNVICIILYQACHSWFQSSRGTSDIHLIENYSTARVGHYFAVLFVISLSGVAINLLPAVKEYVSRIEEHATDLVKTPIMRRPTRHMRRPSRDGESSDEESPLLRAKRHRAYLKYGSGPVLYKEGSMRAGQSLSQRSHEEKQRKPLKKSLLGKLYRTKRTIPNIVMNSEGTPLKAARLKRQDSF